MFLRTLLSGVVALPIALTSVAHAIDRADVPAAQQGGGISFSLPSLRLPGISQRSEAAPVQLAQASDPRITQLEEQVRQLSGTIEELNFQLLQMQDQLRRMQEDNELRFQEMEGRRTDAGGTAPRAQPRQEQDTAAVAPGTGSGDDEFYSTTPPRVDGDSQVLGAPPRDFGTITFDENGNATGGGIAAQPPAASGGNSDGTTVAALPSGGGADALYRNSYEFILSGDYGTAETGFREFIATYPDNDNAADAHFWLGESLLAQEKPREAAEIFLAASRDFPQARKAPDTLFKLGVSLAAMKQRDVACATFSEVQQRYPETTDALKESIKREQAQASC